MVMPAQKTVWTAEMARALPDDGKRYEVLDGVLVVSPAPSALHQRAVAHLWERLAAYCRTHRIGEAMISPADIEFSPRRLVQPDVFVCPLVEGSLIRTWKEVSGLLLAAEVLSPSTARTDRIEKRRIFRDENVPEYWIVDLDARVFERWRPSDERPEILSDTLRWHPVPTVDALEINLVEYFESVLG
jgi:Uma2 family endonuclease